MFTQSQHQNILLNLIHKFIYSDMINVILKINFTGSTIHSKSEDLTIECSLWTALPPQVKPSCHIQCTPLKLEILPKLFVYSRPSIIRWGTMFYLMHTKMYSLVVHLTFDLDLCSAKTYSGQWQY